jgi:hypothetical protein
VKGITLRTLALFFFLPVTFSFSIENISSNMVISFRSKWLKKASSSGRKNRAIYLRHCGTKAETWRWFFYLFIFSCLKSPGTDAPGRKSFPW